MFKDKNGKLIRSIDVKAVTSLLNRILGFIKIAINSEIIINNEKPRLIKTPLLKTYFCVKLFSSVCEANLITDIFKPKIATVEEIMYIATDWLKIPNPLTP